MTPVRWSWQAGDLKLSGTGEPVTRLPATGVNSWQDLVFLPSLQPAPLLRGGTHRVLRALFVLPRVSAAFPSSCRRNADCFWVRSSWTFASRSFFFCLAIESVGTQSSL